MSTRYSISTNKMEYAAEVAYVVATSPPPNAGGHLSEDEFDFSLSETQLSEGLRVLNGKTDPSKDGGALDEVKDGGGGGGEGKQRERERFDSGRGNSEDEKGTNHRFPAGGVLAGATKEQTPRKKKDSDGAPTEDGKDSQKQKMIVIYGSTSYANRQLVSKLVQSNPTLFSLVVQHTSRPRKLSEINGIDFHFVTRQEMTSEIKRGSFIECVKISSSSPKVKQRTPSTSSTGQFSFSNSSPSAKPKPPRAASTSGAQPSPIPVSHTGHAGTATSPLNQDIASSSPQFHRLYSSPLVQVPSPLLTPKTRQRARTNTGSSDIFGSSREAIVKAQMHGKPCIVLNVTCKGAEQLRKAGFDGLYILIDQGEGGVDEPDGNGVDPSSAHQVKPNHVISTDNLEQAFAELQQYTFQTVSNLPLSPRSKYEVTRDVWETLPTVHIDPQTQSPKPFSPQKLVTFSSLLAHYQRASIGKKLEKTKKISGLAKKLNTEWRLAISLSQMQLSNEDPIHFEALRTLYLRLMGSALNCRRYGPHWQDIGFQGVDPAEDLKEVGFFGVMQLINALDGSKTLPLVHEIFSYSHEGPRQFPFLFLSLNMTQIALKSLKSGCLTKLCNKQDQVFVTLNNFFIAIFYRFFQLWKQGQAFTQIVPVLKDVESYVMKHPKNVILDLEAFLQSDKDEDDKAAIRKISRSLSNPFTPFSQLTEFEMPLAKEATPTTTSTATLTTDIHRT